MVIITMARKTAANLNMHCVGLHMADESVTQSIRKIQLFIRRHEDYWKDHVKQKIELEHRLEAML